MNGALFLASDESSFMTGQSLLDRRRHHRRLHHARVGPASVRHLGADRSGHARALRLTAGRDGGRHGPGGLRGQPGSVVGKRVMGRYFLDTVASGSIEACNYLLAVDVEMNPLPGYRFNWDRATATSRPSPT